MIYRNLILTLADILILTGGLCSFSQSLSSTIYSFPSAKKTVVLVLVDENYFLLQGDAGLTGRKIIVDTYGGWGAHGGGAFSGKDFTKVDRSAAYAARWVAKSLVKAGLTRRCLVQVAYAIGLAEPLSITVFDYGTSHLSEKQLLDIVKKNFDLRPGKIVK